MRPTDFTYRLLYLLADRLQRWASLILQRAERYKQRSAALTDEGDAGESEDGTARLEMGERAMDSSRPPEHWINHATSVPPPHWVERVMQSAPELLSPSQTEPVPAPEDVSRADRFGEEAARPPRRPRRSDPERPKPLPLLARKPARKPSAELSAKSETPTPPKRSPVESASPPGAFGEESERALRRHDEPTEAVTAVEPLVDVPAPAAARRSSEPSRPASPSPVASREEYPSGSVHDAQEPHARPQQSTSRAGTVDFRQRHAPSVAQADRNDPAPTSADQARSERPSPVVIHKSRIGEASPKTARRVASGASLIDKVSQVFSPNSSSGEAETVARATRLDEGSLISAAEESGASSDITQRARPTAQPAASRRAWFWRETTNEPAASRGQKQHTEKPATEETVRRTPQQLPTFAPAAGRAANQRQEFLTQTRRARPAAPPPTNIPARRVRASAASMPALNDEPARNEAASALVAGLAPAESDLNLWPDLPVATPTGMADELTAARRETERLQRLELEQRGASWNV